VSQTTEEIKQRQIEFRQCTNKLTHLSEKCNFCVFSFCQVVQKHKLSEMAQYSVF